MNNITPKILTNGIKCIKKACNKAPGIRRVPSTEAVDEFIKTTKKLEKTKKTYVKPKIEVFSAKPDSQMLAASDGHYDNGNHYGNGNGHGHGHGHGYGRDNYDDSYGWDD